MLLVKGAISYLKDGLSVGDVLIDGVTVSKTAVSLPISESCTVIDGKDLLLVPGFADVHVHLREPGFFYKESIESGTSAAASAGYTCVCTMPNLNPVPDSLANLTVQKNIIAKNAKIKVYPYGAITKGEKGSELSDMEELSSEVVAFSDDGRGVQNSLIMKRAMLKAKELNKIIAAHCEDNSLLRGGYIHDGDYAALHGHKGICSESEWRQIERDLRLVEETGCRYHICHVSAKESVELIRRAKKRGLPVTCETAPHYLVLTDADLKDEGRFKMNPPIRSASDCEALLEGLKDGTVDIIATDHAPHSDEEKSKGLKDSLMGVIGLETAFPILYTELVLKNKLPLERLIEAMCVAPRRIFGIPGGSIEEGAPADLALLDLKHEWTVCGRNCLSKGSSTPFEGKKVKSKNICTILDGEIIWKNAEKN